MKFYVGGGGDSSVGIPQTDSVITIEDNYEWDLDMINQFKKFISEFYDNGNLQVYTEDEYDEILKLESDLVKEYKE